MKKKQIRLTSIGMMGCNMLSDEDLAILLAQEKEMTENEPDQSPN